MDELFAKHIKIRLNTLEKICGICNLDGIVMSAGPLNHYFADDQSIIFRTTPHFAHWCPLKGPDHLLKLVPGREPLLIRVQKKDFWYEQTVEQENFWENFFQIKTVATKEEAWEQLGHELNRYAFVGPEKEWAQKKGLITEYRELIARLDWERGVKSDYEISCLSQANERASKAHLAARHEFQQGGTEISIHHAYIKALECQDQDLPYPSIIAINEKAAILHYQQKRKKNGDLLLIDSGASCSHYGSDITRTYIKKTVPTLFSELLRGMEHIQQKLCQEVKVGVDFKELNLNCHKLILDLLIEKGLLQGCSKEEALAKQLSRVFMPHGLGHLLGIQVHDVSGLQKNAEGEPLTPSLESPYLRTGRALREQEVVTIEPGLYFIPMLLEKEKQGENRSYFNEKLIKELTPYGGIRIEDNVIVLSKGSSNLTRKFLGNDYLVL